MSVEDLKEIDIMYRDPKTNELILVITDHLKWNESHLYILQDKINAYLTFLREGDIFRRHPEYRMCVAIVFRLCIKYAPNTSGQNFLHTLKEVLESMNIKLLIEKISK